MSDVKYEIYKVSMVQTFDVFKYKYTGWFSKEKVYSEDTVEGNYKYILAKSGFEAITKYEERYTFDTNEVIDPTWYVNSHYGLYLSETPNFTINYITQVVHPSLDKLKKVLRCDEFFTYCKQEMYPLETVIGE